MLLPSGAAIAYMRARGVHVVLRGEPGQANMVRKWREHYVDYEKLKVLIKKEVARLKALEAAAAAAGGVPISSKVKKKDKLEFNESEPCTMILPQPEIWVGNIQAAENLIIHEEMDLKVLWTVGDLQLKEKKSSCKCMDAIDINDVCHCHP